MRAHEDTHPGTVSLCSKRNQRAWSRNSCVGAQPPAVSADQHIPFAIGHT